MKDAMKSVCSFLLWFTFWVVICWWPTVRLIGGSPVFGALCPVETKTCNQIVTIKGERYQAIRGREEKWITMVGNLQFFSKKEHSAVSWLMHRSVTAGGTDGLGVEAILGRGNGMCKGWEMWGSLTIFEAMLVIIHSCCCLVWIY